MADAIPPGKVEQLQQQGYTNSQIIDMLQHDGFSSQQIFDSMNQSQMPNPGPAAPELSMPSYETSPLSKPSTATQPTGNVSTEEYVEAIIDEKWIDVEDDIAKIIEWKNRSEQRITRMEQQVTDMKDRFDKLHSALIGKIETYDKNILEVGAELQAMEKVFSKVLPTFTSSIQQLQDVSERLDEKTKK